MPTVEFKVTRAGKGFRAIATDHPISLWGWDTSNLVKNACKVCHIHFPLGVKVGFTFEELN